MRLFHYIYFMVALVATSLLTGCRGDGEPTTDPVSYDIVCLRTALDGMSVFTLSKPGSNETIFYHTDQSLPAGHVKVGDRVLIAYTLQGREPYTSGRITLKGYSILTNLTLKKIDLDTIPAWDADPVYLISSWMSEDFLNMRAGLPYDERPRALAIGVDVNTLDQPRPQCYLIHTRQSLEPTFDRNFYLSADMSPLRQWCTATSFTLNLNDDNLEQRQIQFTLNN